MAQPVKKHIQEAHPDLMTEEPIYTLLIDGNAILFHAFADNKVNSAGVHYGGVYQFLLQMKMMMQKKDFDYVYCFFDDEFSGYSRWELYKPYKANRDKHYEYYGESEYAKEFNATVNAMQKYLFGKNKPKEEAPKKVNAWQEFVDANFDRERDILCKYFNELYVRWNIDEITEADDQIAYYCLHKKPNEKIIIMTGDMDISQLIAEDIAIYNINLKKFITTKNFEENFGYNYQNVLVKKIFTGDSSDNIGNIKGLSEDGFFKLMPEAKTRAITVEEVKERAQNLINERIQAKKKPLVVHQNIINGVSNKEYEGDFYEINEKIIDLKRPILSKDAIEIMDSMMYAPQDPEGRSFKNLYTYIVEDKIEELMGDTKFASFFNTFKRLEEKEVKRYEESLRN